MGRRAVRVLGAALMAMALVAAASAGIALAHSPSPRVSKAGSVYTVELGTRSYTYDAAWRVEKAWSRGSLKDSWAPVPLRAPWLEEFRGTLLRWTGTRSLDGIPDEGADARKAIHALGYI